jgi:hypothetical protein
MPVARRISQSVTDGSAARRALRTAAYEVSVPPAYTPMAPGKRSGSQPALSSASTAHSRKIRCCGSMMRASRGE